jgi:hypothetical protein
VTPGVVVESQPAAVRKQPAAVRKVTNSAAARPRVQGCVGREEVVGMKISEG